MMNHKSIPKSRWPSIHRCDVSIRSKRIIGSTKMTRKARMDRTIAAALKNASQILNDAGVPEARREAGSLLSFILGKDRTFLIAHAEDQIEDNSLRGFQEAVERRAAGEPLQYITGVQDFFGREFHVTPDVLIPRPETELLVEAAREIAVPAPVVCDVGTGSGCI